MKTMILVFAHPGDESFSAAGTVSKYVKQRWSVHLIIAANGQKCADLTDTAQITAEQKETKQAAAIVGIQSVTFLGLPHEGLTALTPGTLEDPLYTAMYKLLPDVVITHDTTGMNNHADHIRVCYATTYAFQKYVAYLVKAGDIRAMDKGRGKVWKEADYERAFGQTHSQKEPKLYYVCLPQSSVDFLRKQKQIPKESFGKPRIGVPDKEVTTIIDIADDAIQKGKALLAYKMQSEKVDQFISFAPHPQARQECFILRMQGVYEVFMGKSDAIAASL